MEEEKVVFISTSQVADFIYPRLLELGYAPTSDEILDLADIVFDFLLNVDFIDDEKVEEE